ncbi:MAG: Ger(x)C family spore germination protein [Bacillota bacterium]
MTRSRWLALILLGSLLLSGCWDRRELTDVSLVGLIGIDREEDQYLVTLNVLIPQRGGQQGGGGSSGETGVRSVVARAGSLDEAVAKANQALSRDITLTHVRAIILGEEFAREGIAPALDFLLRSVEVRPTAWIAVTVGSANEFLQVRPQQERVPIEGPVGYHDFVQARSGIIRARRLVDVANILQEEGIDLALPLFRRASEEHPNPDGGQEATGNQEELIYGGAGLFIGDRLVDWMSPDQARGILWASGRITRTAVVAPCEDPERRAVFRVRWTKGSVRVTARNQELAGEIRVKVVADLNETTCEEQLISGADLSRAEALLADQVERELIKTVSILRETGSDFLGLGQTLYRKAPALFRAHEAEWPERLAEMDLRIVIEAIVPRTGQMKQRFH